MSYKSHVERRDFIRLIPTQFRSYPVLNSSPKEIYPVLNNSPKETHREVWSFSTKCPKSNKSGNTSMYLSYIVDFSSEDVDVGSGVFACRLRPFM